MMKKKLEKKPETWQWN